MDIQGNIIKLQTFKKARTDIQAYLSKGRKNIDQNLDLLLGNALKQCLDDNKKNPQAFERCQTEYGNHVMPLLEGIQRSQMVMPLLKQCSKSKQSLERCKQKGIFAGQVVPSPDQRKEAARIEAQKK